MKNLTLTRRRGPMSTSGCDVPKVYRAVEPSGHLEQTWPVYLGWAGPGHSGCSGNLPTRKTRPVYRARNTVNEPLVCRRGTPWVHVVGTPWVPLQCPEPGNRDQRSRHTFVTRWEHCECPGSGHHKETIGNFEVVLWYI